MHVLTVFAKDPRLGHSKSRLARAIGDEQAFGVAQALLADTLQSAKSVRRPDEAGLTKSVFYTPSDQSAQERFAGALPSFVNQPQHGNTLGHRLVHCCNHWFQQNANCVVIIGTDCPTLSAKDIEQAFTLLDDADVVLGPATDGGYYLIGLSAPQSCLFENIDWSTSSVLAQTVDRIRQAQLTLHLLPPKSDLDHIEDIGPIYGQLEAAAAANSNVGQSTHNVLRGLLASDQFEPPPYELVHFDDIDPVPCPCGRARRAFARAADFPATVHQTEITLDAQAHLHRNQTEVYVILECGTDAALELNGARVPIRVGSTILIRPGCVHRALGQMKVLIICSPKFDPKDEFLVE